MLSCCPPSTVRDRLVLGWVISSASVDAVADSGVGRMTNVASPVKFILVGLQPGLSIAFEISKVSSW